MQATPRRNGFLVLAFVLAMFIIVTLAFSSTTWAAPNAQGTVPTPPVPTDTAPTAVPPGDGDGGNDNGDNGGNDNGGSDDSNAPADDSGNGGSQDDDSGGTAPTAAAGAGSVCAIGDGGAQCSAGELNIVVGAGAANPGSALTIEGSFPQPPCPPSPAGHTFLNRCYRYTWINTSAEPMSSINAPVQYCINYGAAELAAVNNDPASFLIGVMGADGAWSMLKPVVDLPTGRACVTSNQLVVWSALFAPPTASELLPTVGATQDQLWMAAVAGIGVVLLLGASWLRKTARR
ncbi:MAG: hypothetical protein IT331_08975 [Anaerolineae bacterium]|nr:hypothetical protein [Anaerolineae bacterium]